MTKNMFLEKLADGKTTLGAWMMLREPMVAAAATALDYDYLCVDMQHGVQDYGDVVAQLYTAARSNVTPIARTPANEPGIVGRLLDAGALGIIFPMINTVEEAQRAVAACRYAPDGSRSMGPVGAMTLHGGDYFGKANAEVAAIPMIETAQAISNLDEILSVPGVDTIYVGPSDLSLTLGLGPGLDNDDPKFIEAIDTILAGCAKHGVSPGIHCSPELAGKRHEQGFRMLSVGYDFGPVMAALRSDLKTSRAATT
ncbi:MAG: 4-hydroxy-2-oxoheptanedioate aldolase [Acidimicrobiales bacterium]|jgi:4-hydroxy-2-oxoheptanedioate aldolase